MGDSLTETSFADAVDQEAYENDNSPAVVDEQGNSERRELLSEPEVKSQRTCSPALLICLSHTLAAWGDRMWEFAIPILLISLTPNSLRLVAIYGMVVSLSVVAFGTLVGHWIDETPRLKATRLTIIIENSAVVACAGILYVMLILEISTTLFYLLEFALILMSIITRLASLGTTIAIERDWVVVIAEEDEALLAGTNAKLRRIDLTCNILAPVITGLVFSVGSKVIGICFIAGWNILSLLFESYILTIVYHSCPALGAKTMDERRRGKFEGAINHDEESCENSCSSSTYLSAYGTVTIPLANTVDKSKNSIFFSLDRIKSQARTIRLGVKLYFQQEVALAGVGLACLYLTVLGFNSITTGYAYSQHLNEAVLSILTAAGALTGIIGTFIYPKFRKIFGLARTGVISMSIQLFFLMFCVASVWAPGHPGHLLDRVPDLFRDHMHSSDTKSTASSGALVSNHISATPHEIFRSAFTIHPSMQKIEPSISNLSVCPTASIASDTLLGRRFRVAMATANGGNATAFHANGPSQVRNNITTLHASPSSAIFTISTSASINGNHSKGNFSRKNDTTDAPSSYIHLGLLMGGLVMSRTGLWMTDLVITQLFQENVAEKERGIVGGVQNSFNNIMDVAHFVLVIVAPKPEHFGALILVSVSMVSLGFSLYARFFCTSRKELSH